MLASTIIFNLRKLFYTVLLVSLSYPRTFFVSQDGDNSNPGTIQLPLLTIQAAADSMQSGDTCYIRQGIYHEKITISDQSGTDALPMVFSGYQGERVVIDGTKPINSMWLYQSGNIWKNQEI